MTDKITAGARRAEAWASLIMYLQFMLDIAKSVPYPEVGRGLLVTDDGVDAPLVNDMRGYLHRMSELLEIATSEFEEDKA